MYGLLAFKRPDPNNPGFDQVAFEIRSYSCFNGFNRQDAFKALRDPDYRNFDLVMSKVSQNGSISTNSRDHIHTLEVGQDVPIMRDNTDWECLGLGVALYTAASNVTFANTPAGAEPPLVDYRIAPLAASDAMNHKVTTLANFNGIQKQYWSDGKRCSSHREFTPNEQYLANFFEEFQKGLFESLKNYIGMSKMFQLLARNWNHQSGLYQFVGSERPSGLAVSYLQIWRNTMEKNSGGWANKTDLLQALSSLYNQYINSDRKMDVMPILSMLLHKGDDSDIVTFVGIDFVAYSVKHGLFNQGQFYRTTVSMLEEGRYNKGGQSEAIRNNFRRTLGELKLTDSSFLSEAMTSMDVVKNGMKDQASLRDLVANTKDSLLWCVIEEYDHKNYERIMKDSIVSFERLLRAVTIKSVKAQIQEMLGAISKIPDFRQPAKVSQAVPELSKSPMGFSTWAAQADAPTAEEPVPVAHTIH